MSSEERRQLLVLLFSIFVGSIGLGILTPLVPQLFSGHAALFPNLGYGAYGLLVAVFPLSQFCAAFALAAASDRFGRKGMLLISLWGTVVGYILTVAALALRDLPLLFIARAIDGVTGGNIGITQAAIADITPKEVRASRLGLIGGAFGLGLILGPVIGGTLASAISLPAPFVVAALIATVNVLLVWRYLPYLPPTSRAELALGQEMLAKVREYFQSPRLRGAFTASFLYNCAMAAFNAFFPVFLVERFHFSATQIGLYYAYVGILYAANQFLIVPRISKRFSQRLILLVGTSGLALAMLGYAVSFVFIFMFAVSVLFTVANGTNQANLVGLLSVGGNADEQGKILGLNSSLIALAQTVMPPLAGTFALGLSGGLPILAAAVLMATVPLVLAPILSAPLKKPSPIV